jgi:hypothetical protein
MLARFYNMDADCWVRSGKASKSYGAQYNQNAMASMLKSLIDLESKFYMSYPDQNADKDFVVEKRICYFSELDCYMSIGYDTSQETRNGLCNVNIFTWLDSVM